MKCVTKTTIYKIHNLHCDVCIYYSSQNAQHGFLHSIQVSVHGHSGDKYPQKTEDNASLAPYRGEDTLLEKTTRLPDLYQ